MILVLDNYDSFVETLARYIREAGFATEIVRSDVLSQEDIAHAKPEAIVMSPGPYGPDRAGICRDLPSLFPKLPMLGVCLGHLAIAENYGARTVPARSPIHGRSTKTQHDGSHLFVGVPNPFLAGRYHALISDIEGTDLVSTAWSNDELMAFRHPQHPHFGVQFHPESLLTEGGRAIVRNFLTSTDVMQ
ncbi:MAG: aminodeoxychorismate/anthranilate synthase component II [Pseudomonadota bacterium]